MAALESGVITPSTTIVDRGIYTYYEFPQPRCWIYNATGGTHGAVNVSQAITVSCNYFFYEVGRLTGIQRLDDYASQFGLGRSTGDVYKRQVCTGVTVRRGAKICTAAQHTDVYFRPATERELRGYIRTGEPMDKAGAYGVQGKGALLVERIDGDFFNVMGLPVGLLARLLKGFGIDLME